MLSWGNMQVESHRIVSSCVLMSFNFFHQKCIGFICYRKHLSGNRTQDSTKSQTHPTTILSFLSLFPTPQSFISWNSSPCFHSSGLSVPFSDSSFRVFCREKNCWEEGTSQLTKTAACCPRSRFSSLPNTRKLLLRSVTLQGFISYAGFPG